jgi:hypothetical protein
MFGWFQPNCGCTAPAKEWLEASLHWLCAQFPEPAFAQRTIVLPTWEFFPKRRYGSEDSVRAALDRTCEYMDVDPSQIDLEFFDEPQLTLVNKRGHGIPGRAGVYDESNGRYLIWIENSQTTDPIALIGTLAHELAHVKLLGESRIDGDVFDNELLTDLTAVFFGMGIFLANCPRSWYSQFTLWPNTRVKKPEYMTIEMYAYALAHFAWHQGEQRPAWSKHLNADAFVNFKHASRFLWKTTNSTFKPLRSCDE